MKQESKPIPSSNTKRKCIFVLGMHRSGTSAMAGLLKILGVDLGNDLMPADQFNEKGYFEHNGVFELNEKILNLLGVNWHTTYLLEENWENSRTAQQMIAKIRTFFRDYFIGSKCFAIKDPRLCVLLPLWLKALKSEDLETKFIIVIRHPDEVVASMSKPHPQIKERASLLWLDHNFKLEQASRDHRRFFVSFNTLLGTPDKVVADLKDFLQCNIRPSQSKIHSFLDSRLRHNRSRKVNPFLQLTTELWNTLQQFCISDNSKYRKIIDDLYSQHIQLLKVYGKPYHKSKVDVEEEKKNYQINQLRQHLQTVEDQLQDSEKRLEHLVSRSHKLELKIESLQRSNIQLVDEIEIIRDASRKKENQISDLKEEIAYNERLIDSYEDQISELESNISLLRDDVDRTQNLVNRKEADIQKSYEMALKMIEQVSTERAKRRAQLENITAELATNRERLDMVQNEFMGLQNHANNLERDIMGLHKSVSFRLGWWLTRPFSLVLNFWKNAKWLINTIRITPSLAYTLWTNPRHLFRHLSANNLSRFQKAIAEEHPTQVLRNLRRYIKRDPQELDEYVTSKDNQYQVFLQQNRLRESEIDDIKSQCQSFTYRPLISIITPVFNTDPSHLNNCIWSVIRQYYSNWELCIYDDCSDNRETIACLKKWQGKDARIQISFGDENLHISAASNKAIETARGEFIALLDHDDEITPDALFRVVEALNTDGTIDFIYSDEDKIEMDGSLSTPHFKPDFNLDLLLSHNYICHFSVIRKIIGDRLGWFRVGFEGSQDYDLFLRIIDKTRKIHHIPRVLYHWRKVTSSTAESLSNKSYIEESSTRALNDYLERNQILGSVQPGLFVGSWRVKRKVKTNGMVSIIIPFKDQVSLLRQCIESIFDQTLYSNYEILLVSNSSKENDTFSYLERLRGHEKITVLEYNIPFNFSKINNWAVRRCNGEFILLLNNDTQIITKGWLMAMLEHIQREEVGAVGAKLYYPNQTIQHAGVVIGIGGVAAHVHNHLASNNISYFGRASILQNVSACTGACLLVKKSLFLDVGGLDEIGLKIAFNDIDLCLKIRKLGRSIVFTPYAELYHHESVSRGYEDTIEKQKRFSTEIRYFQEKWKSLLQQGDPNYNHNLTLTRTDFSLNIQD